MSEHLTVVLITYERTDYAVQTVKAIEENFRYPNWSWYISDDGSRPEHVEEVMNAIDPKHFDSEYGVGGHSIRASYGAGCNRGLEWAFQRGSLVLMLEDDWRLSREFDIWKYAALLMERPDIGMVRTGYINQGIYATLLGHNGALYWGLDDTQSRNYSSFAFAGHPAIIHSRFFDKCGRYPERWQPGDTELRMCWQVASAYGPKIVWPAELGERGPWDHIGGTQSYIWNGGQELGADKE